MELGLRKVEWYFASFPPRFYATPLEKTHQIFHILGKKIILLLQFAAQKPIYTRAEYIKSDFGYST